MRHFRFRLLNVFAQSTLGGNPLAVFEDGGALSDEEMQALALQFNLSETTFLLPSSSADAHVRIFTPSFEMPFAGHPTLGSAHVVRDLKATGDSITLEMRAGLIPVEALQNQWTLRAKAPTHRTPTATVEQIAAAVGLQQADIVGQPLWINTGSEQLVIPVKDPDTVARSFPNVHAIAEHFGEEETAMFYVWARDGLPVDGVQQAKVRFYFPKNGAPAEDPGTGSACANLGGYLLTTGTPLPQRWQLSQGSEVKRPCQLELSIDAERNIFVGGQVLELGRGEIHLPD